MSNVPVIPINGGDDEIAPAVPLHRHDSIASGKEKEVEYTNLDAGAKFLAEYGDATPITAEESARVRRKIDIRLLPLMAIMYFMQQLDKSSVSYASVFSLQTDAHLTSQQYAWLTTIVYIAAIVGQPASTYALSRFPVGRFISINYVGWSVCMILTTACKSFSSLLALRFFLGLFEASIAPTMMVVVSMWWTRREQGFRSQWWYLQNGLATIIGSLLTWAIGKAEGSKLLPFQRIFLTLGCLSLAAAIPTCFLFPNSPLDAKFLTHDEKRIALERVKMNQTGVQGTAFKWSQLLELVLDIKTWLIVAIILPKAITAGGISAFGPLIIKGFGFDKFHTILFNMIPGAIQIVLGLLSGWFMTSFKWKSPALTVYVIVSLVGSIGLYCSPRGNEYRSQLLGFYCLLQFSGAVAPLAFAWANSNVAGGTKKAGLASIEWAFVCVGNAIGPQIFGADKAPYYHIGLRSQLISLSVILGAVALLVFWLAFLNRRNATRRRDRGATGVLVDLSLERESKWGALRAQQHEIDQAESNSGTALGGQGFLDLTDLENDEFIYSY